MEDNMTEIPDDIFLPQTQSKTGEKAILIVTADKTEDQEFFYPYYRFIEEGYRVDVATPDGGEFKGKNGAGLSQSKRIDQVDAQDYDLLYIPGGKAPAKLKKEEEAVDLVQSFYQTGRPIAAICHGAQLLAAADVIEGRDISAWPEVEDEINDANGNYIGSECIIDGQFITARWPGDLPAFTRQVLQVLKSAKQGNSKQAA